jgi:hypothetical protein
MLRSVTVPGLLPIDAFRFFMGFDISVPSIYSRANQLSVVALNYLHLLFNGLQPIICIHRFDGVRECWRLGPLKFFELIPLLGLGHWLLTLSLHISHRLLHSLQHLSLHYKDLLKSWWWRQIGSIVVIVLICGVIVSVLHLMIMKIFETEMEIEIKDSQLYASRYNDD